MNGSAQPAGGPAVAPTALGTRLQAVMNAAAAELSRAGEAERLQRLRVEAERPRDSPPTVIVAGESKSGKSALINALVRRPGLSPVGADVATGSWVAFTHAPSERASVRLMGQSKTREIALDEVADWVSVERNPGNAKGVQSVTIGLHLPLLTGMTLVDTPGIGGLDAGHGTLTLQALRDADALLFVADADGPLSAAELRFLSRAAERIDTVALVLTKTDLYAGWETIAADNADLLSQKAPRFAGCPTAAVSSLNAERARSLADDPEGPAILEDSGLPSLERILDEHVRQRTGVLRLANAVRLAHSSLRAVERRVREQLAAAGGDPAVGEALARERERLIDLQREKAGWPRTMDRELRRITIDRTDEITQGITEVRVQYDTVSAQAGKDELVALPGQLLAEVTALEQSVAAAASERIKQLAVQIIGEIESDSSLADTLQGLTQVVVGSETPLATPVERKATEMDRLTTLISFTSGKSIAGLAVSFAGLTVGAPFAIATISVGALFAWKMGRGRSLLMLQTDFRSWQREQLALAQNRINNQFSRQMIDLHSELHDTVSAYLVKREQEVTAALSANEGAQRLDAQARQSHQAAAEAQLSQVRAVIAEAARVLTDLGTARG